MYDVVNFSNGTYGVLEIQTNRLIKKDLRLFDARSLVHILTRGAGFQGNTPSFMTVGDYNEKT